jgi:imidazole glycerol phosphate synthase subunit HisF
VHAVEDVQRLLDAGAQAALAASLFHDRVLSVREVKEYLAERGIPVRMGEWTNKRISK